MGRSGEKAKFGYPNSSNLKPRSVRGTPEGEGRKKHGHHWLDPDRSSRRGSRSPVEGAAKGKLGTDSAPSKNPKQKKNKSSKNPEIRDHRDLKKGGRVRRLRVFKKWDGR